MNMNPEEFLVLQSGMGAKDVEIARLREEVASLTKERDLWKARALESCPVAAKKAEELVCYLPKNMSITIVALSLLLAKVIAVATQGKRKMKREKMTEGIFDFIRRQI